MCADLRVNQVIFLLLLFKHVPCKISSLVVKISSVEIFWAPLWTAPSVLVYPRVIEGHTV